MPLMNEMNQRIDTFNCYSLFVYQTSNDFHHVGTVRWIEANGFPMGLECKICSMTIRCDTLFHWIFIYLSITSYISYCVDIFKVIHLYPFGTHEHTKRIPQYDWHIYVYSTLPPTFHQIITCIVLCKRNCIEIELICGFQNFFPFSWSHLLFSHGIGLNGYAKKKRKDTKTHMCEVNSYLLFTIFWQ